MNEAKFTKGPWEAEIYPDSLEAQVIAPICGTEATEEIAWIGEVGFKTQSDANAHLIAAAPEMYEMLLIAEGYALANKHNAALAEAIGEVLAKARGES